MPAPAKGAAWQEWKGHWTVVLAAGAGTGLGALAAYALGVFFQPLEEEFGWSRAGISAGVTIYAVIGILFAPAAGYLLDRVGCRRFGIPGAAIYCVAFAALALVTDSIWSWWAAWLIFGLAGLGIKPSVWTKAISSFFVAGRGLAVALMLCGTAIASSALPLIAHKLIDLVGWRGAFAGIGAIFLIVVLPLLWLFLYDISDRKVQAGRVDTAAPAPVDRNEHARSLPGWTIADGLRKRQLWQIAAAGFVSNAINIGFIVHIIPMLTGSGLDQTTAVSVVASVGILSAFSRVGVGLVFDRISHPAVGVLSMAMPALPAIILFTGAPGLATAILAVVGLAIALGGVSDAVYYLSSRYFGLRNLGFLFSIVVSAVLMGLGLGPVIAGQIYDMTGNYEMFMMAAIPSALIAGVLIATLGRYPDHTLPKPEQ